MTQHLGAESKDPEDAYLVDAVRSFSTAQARTWRTGRGSSPGKNNSKAGGAKKLNLIRTLNPEFKDLAQTWGWKLITVHERMYAAAIKCVLEREF